MSRSDRDKRTTSEQLAYTLDIYKNNKSYQVDELFDNYERYTNNLSVDRLIFPKYFDLFDIKATENRRDYFINYYYEKFITILPLPALNLFGYKIDKFNYTLSSKSILENVEGGGLYSLGSIVAEFKYVFGNFFVFFWFVFVLLVFVFFHAFQKKNDYKIILSPIALIFIWSIYHFFFFDSIHQSIGIIRGIVQTSIVYYLYYQIYRLKIKI